MNAVIQNTGSISYMGKTNGPDKWFWYTFLFFLALVIVGLFFESGVAFAQISLPGEDQSDKLDAMGTVLRIVDTGLFKWMSRIMAGLCIMSSAWCLKEQAFGRAVICIIGALMFGLAPQFVKQLFDIGGNASLFSFQIESLGNEVLAILSRGKNIYV
jgi:hypothetical protein